MVLSILLGFIVGWSLKNFLVIGGKSMYELEVYSIGYIIPGLIANWMEKQGTLRTLGMIAIASVIVRLILIVVTGGEVTFNV